MVGMETFKCPSCDGTIEFNVGTQNLKCPYCDSEFDIDAIKTKDERFEQNKEDSFIWSETSSRKWESGETDGLAVYACEACGGEIVGEENMGSTQCPYCGNKVVFAEKFAGDLRPDYVIPFKYDKKQAQDTFKKFVGSEKFVPKLFKSENYINEMKGVYVPFWLFDADVKGEASFNAQTVNTYRRADSRVTETKHYNLSRTATMKFENVPVDGSSKINNDVMESLEPFNFEEAVDFNTAYLAGFTADKYDVNHDDCIERANARIKKSVETALREAVMNPEGSSHNNSYDYIDEEWSSVKIENGKAKYVLCPVWMLSATYKDECYTFAMNGQTGKYAGDIPIDKNATKKNFLKWTVALGVIFYAVKVLLALL